MNEDLYQYIYDAMNWALEVLEAIDDPNYNRQYEKLDRAIGLFDDWHQTLTKRMDDDNKTNSQRPATSTGETTTGCAGVYSK